jgi:intracellular sulfur oxidation DsrE/DsrF family protein
MTKIIPTIKMLALGTLLPVLSMAQISQVALPAAYDDVKVQNVVFDCSSGNEKYIASRLWLIDLSIEEYKNKGIPYNAVLTIHSGCTKIVSQNVDADDKMMKNIHEKLKSVAAHENISIEACQIAVDRHKIKHSDLHPFIKLVPNSITRVISLQNDGYALIPFGN